MTDLLSGLYNSNVYTSHLIEVCAVGWRMVYNTSAPSNDSMEALKESVRNGYEVVVKELYDEEGET